MPFYSRSAYGPDPHAGANRNNAAERGWGSGWRNCQTSKQARVSKAGVVVPVRSEIAQLVAVLFAATEKRFNYDIKSGQTWGFACRAIRGTNVASNHSWGLAVDINSLSNPMQSSFKSDMPPAMVEMWEACGFYWGGRYRNRPDAMHYEYIFRPSHVAKHLAKAKGYLSGTAGAASETTPKATTEREDDVTPEELHAELRPMALRIETLFTEVKDAQAAEEAKRRASALRIEALFSTVLSELGVADDKIDAILAAHPLPEPTPPA